MRWLTRTARYIVHRFKKDQIHLSWGAEWDRSTATGPGVRLGRNAKAVASTLGGDVELMIHSAVNQSTIGRFVRVGGGSHILESAIGSYSYTAPYVALFRTTVGKFCSIGPNLTAGSGVHPVRYVSTSPAFYSTARQCLTTFTDVDTFKESLPITIGNDVFIGARSYIVDGVTVGDGAVIAAGAVVVRDVPPYAIVGGVSAKLIRYRFSPEQIAALLEIRWWDWDADRLKAAQPYMASEDVDAFIRWAKG